MQVTMRLLKLCVDVVPSCSEFHGSLQQTLVQSR